MFPEELGYTDDHVWVKIEGDVLTMGITNYAQEEMGDITFIELPEVGVEIEEKEDFIVIESIKAASNVYSPLTGVVASVNGALENIPELINSDPYGEGWICTFKGVTKADLVDMMTAEDYKSFIANK